MAGVNKFRSIVIDTVNQLQSDEYMKQSKKPNFDEWMDFGKELYVTVAFCKELDPRDIVPILILGKEGTGKTVGASTLNSEETYYLNTDRKPLSFPGWRQKYKRGTINEGGNYRDDVTDYETVRKAISAVYNNRKEDGPFFVFILAHVEDVKTVNGLIGQKLKTLGKVATKQNIEGAVIHAYYTDIDQSKPITDVSRYRFRVNTSGLDTARSPMGYWKDAYIPNDFQMIINRVVEMEY